VRRSLILVAVGAIALAGALVASPTPPEEPLAGLIIDRPGIESPVDSAIWYCPWAQADSEKDSFIALESLAPASAQLTLPVAIPGEPPDHSTVSMPGPGAAGVTLSSIAERGDSPAFIEFDGGPSAASVTVTGGVVAADDCVTTGPDEWFFPGGSTMTGEHLVLRLFNPFPETAKVTVSGFSEIGEEALGELRSVSINPRSWRDIAFEELLRQRQSLVISVHIEQGLAIPAMAWSNDADQGWWSGTGLSTTWEFPVVRDEGLDQAAVVIANPSDVPVDVTVDLFTEEGPQTAAFSLTVPAQSPLRIGFGEVDATVVGARVTATGPVAATVVATGDAGTAITAGSPEQAPEWFLPGARTRGRLEAALWLLNSSDETVSVTISALTGADPLNTQVILAPGTITRFPVGQADARGYLVTSPDAFSAAWSLTGPNGSAFSAGIPVPQPEGSLGVGENLGG
jgi:hypothetical protein